ncbi:MAG TPA: PAS domain S-box protein, partial [Herpetosiphonaceae bacterium]|nr:PAS domain S-box protein [Herpetosiphonaceae bacterium]
NKELAAVSELAQATAYGLADDAGAGLPAPPPDQLTTLPDGTRIDRRPGRISDLFLPAEADPAALAVDLSHARLLDAAFAGQYRAARNIRAITFVGGSGAVQSYPPRPGVSQPLHDRRLLAMFGNGRRAPLWLNPYERPAEQGVLTTVVVPIYAADDRFQGVIAVDVSLVFLNLNLEALLPTANSSAFLIDQQRTLITATPSALAYLLPGRPAAGQAAGLTQTLTLSATSDPELDRGIDRMLFSPDRLARLVINTDRLSIGGEQFFLAYAPILETGWMLGLLTPIDELTTRATDVSGVIVDTNKTVLLALFGGAIMFTVLAALAALYFVRRLTRPLAQLTAAAVAIGQGRYEQQLALDSQYEFSRLAAAFNTMSKSIVRANAALRDSEERYRLITEQSHDLISMLDAHERFAYASPSYEPILGYAPALLLGRAALEIIHPDDQPIAHAAWLRAMAGASGPQALLRLRNAEGSWCWIDTQCSVIEYGGDRYILSVGRDITERKRLESQLLQAQKMESIGRLAGGVAHDFNNLLTAITGYAELALETLPPEIDLRADLEEIRRAAERATALTRQLLTFARKQAIELKVLDLNALIADVEKLLRRLLGESIAIVIMPAPGLGLIRADAGQLEQVMVNLAVNARDAMPGGGTLTIETCNVVLDEDYTREHIDVTPGAYVMLVISDTGSGIAEAAMPHVFEPFFTTKEAGRGTGLGLATCYGIVKQHGGAIWVYSEPDHGTSFKIYLPCVAEAAEQASGRADPAALPRGQETILLVEDEVSVRALAARVLRDLGYTVLEAVDGSQALELLKSCPPGTLDLLLTDVVMPQMGGMLLANRLLELHPTCKILYMSGYTENGMAHHSRLDLAASLLHKPFSPSMLAAKVREILDRP